MNIHVWSTIVSNPASHNFVSILTYAQMKRKPEKTDKRMTKLDANCNEERFKWSKS